MKLIKGYSPVLEMHCWTLRQEACGRVWERRLGILAIEFERASYPRNCIAWRVWNARRELRRTIAQFQLEQAHVQD